MNRLGRVVIAVLCAGFLGGLFVEESQAALDPNDEYIIVTGGPALLGWESFRREAHRHDRWWGNFVRASRIRMEQLQKATKGTINITWLVYRPGYESRANEDGEPLISHIESVRDKFKVNLVWYSSGDDIINYVNTGRNRRQTQVSGFEYFGHSNKYCFCLDYSNHVLGASQAFLHQRDLKNMNRKAFARGAYAKSWGCHSGEAFCAEFKRVTGVKMIGAIGKTDYSDIYKGLLPFVSPGGRWTG